MVKKFDPDTYLQSHPDPEIALRLRQQMDEISVLIEKMNAREQSGNKVIVMAAMMFLTGSFAYSLYQFSDVNTSFTSSLPSLFGFLDYSKARAVLCALAKYDMLPVDYGSEDPYLIRTIYGGSRHPKTRPIRVCIPVGLSAGLDVDCEGPSAFGKLGFGSVDVGIVSIDPSPGVASDNVELFSNSLISPKERRDSSEGLDVVAARYCDAIDARDSDLLARNTVTGITIEVTDATHVDRIFAKSRLIGRADYISLDVTSCSEEAMVSVVKHVDECTAKQQSIPLVFLKVNLAQSLPPSKALVDAITASSAVIGVNVNGTGLAAGSNKQITKFDTHGKDIHVAGLIVKEKSTEAVGEWYKALGRGTGGKEIFASGGIASGKDALAKIEAGASMVNVFSSFLYDGFHVARRIKTQLSVQFMNKGYYVLEEAIGSNHRQTSQRLKQSMKRRKKF